MTHTEKYNKSIEDGTRFANEFLPSDIDYMAKQLKETCEENITDSKCGPECPFLDENGKCKFNGEPFSWLPLKIDTNLLTKVICINEIPELSGQIRIGFEYAINKEEIWGDGDGYWFAPIYDINGYLIANDLSLSHFTSNPLRSKSA